MAESYRGMYKNAFPLFHNFEAAISMASTARIVGCFPFAPNNTFPQHRCRRHSIRILSTAGESSAASLTSDSAELSTVAVNGAAPAAPDLLNRNRFAIPNETTAEEAKGFREEKLEPLWDDGYGSETVKQYFEYAEDLIRPDGGPARWFTPISCGPPLKDSPVLLFLPGMDGLGVGLILHHKALGKVFDVRCMHIPVQDRTPFQDLVKWVEETVKAEHSSSPNKPIYLLGDSFGGCLALAVAARNPHIDLVLILTNPATSFGASQLQPILPLLEALPDELHIALPYLLSFVMGDPVKMAAIDIDKTLPPARFFEQLSSKITGLLPCLSGLSDIIPKETLLWRLKLLRDSAAYTNSRLHAVKAEVLVLASGKDNMLPSRDEAWRLMRTLQNCDVRYFKDNGHTILLEDGVNLLTIIKGTTMYRRTSKSHDYVLDFIPPSISEFQQIQQNGWFRNFVGPVFLSTREDGSIVRGLEGVPSEGPVLFVGYHMLMGFDLGPLIEQFLREKKIMVRGMAHPFLFSEATGNRDKEFSYPDTIRLYGAVPVTASNLFKMLKAKSHVLLYPGGAREALHKKGEEYKLFWPDDPEFVRMAARFGATIVPFGSVGEDDIAELVLDIEDQLRIPFWGDKLRNDWEKYKSFNIRAGKRGEVSNQVLHLPGLLPKVSGRYYYLFGKPISTKGRDEMLKDRDKARELYLHVKSQVEANIAYLLEKRERDPYRGVVDRTVYRAFHSPMDRVPTFEP